MGKITVRVLWQCNLFRGYAWTARLSWTR